MAKTVLKHIKQFDFIIISFPSGRIRPRIVTTEKQTGGPASPERTGFRVMVNTNGETRRISTPFSSAEFPLKSPPLEKGDLGGF
jgi:hypothetical protein